MDYLLIRYFIESNCIREKIKDNLVVWKKCYFLEGHFFICRSIWDDKDCKIAATENSTKLEVFIQ